MKKNFNVRFLIKLFTTFFKIGMFTFGGGFAMIPLMEKELVERHGWLDKKQFIDSISLTQTIPGAVAINLAIFLGYNLAGLPGALAATVGVALPSFLIILLIAISFNRFRNNQIIENVFKGIRPTVVALIAYAGVKLIRTIDWSVLLIIVLIVTLIARILFDINPVILIVAASMAGLINYFLNRKTFFKDQSEE
ncbi:chromate transporter [Anoxybacter fermentans]|uniref:Chromate transporter n=1 Tax=Anoxybacter fermentans TaxID=1323375 RepID=A0A3S9T0T5_9FIRM|nr:chromate transporter [Anoxybacter fermentans]AZR74120.1 chromate transporter [Anoxybacter fermentans]